HRILADHRTHSLGQTIEPTAHVGHLNRQEMCGPCVRSNARRLGRPIMLPLPIQKAMHADDAHRSRVLSQCFGPEAAAPQSPYQSPQVPVSRQRQFQPQQTSMLPLRERASSSRKIANHEERDHDKTPPLFARSQSVRKPTPATLSTLPFARASPFYTAARQGDLQDGVYIALTEWYDDFSPLRVGEFSEAQPVWTTPGQVPTFQSPSCRGIQ